MKNVIFKKRKAWMIRAFMALVTYHLSLITSFSQSFMQIGSGTTDVLDTYLSQEKFKGTGMTFLSLSEHRGVKVIEKQEDTRPSSLRQDDDEPLVTPLRWSTIVQNQVSLSLSEDRDENKSMMEATYNLLVGRYCSLVGRPSATFHIQAGALANATLGCLYNTRNGNNPVQARIGLQLMPSGIATWHFRLFKSKNESSGTGRASLRYEVDVPLVGLAFSPNYGQSYFEIFAKDNYDHNIVPTTFVSAPYFRQQLTFSCAVSRKLTLQLGYLGDYQQLQVNNLKQHVYAHRMMIGVAKGF